MAIHNPSPPLGELGIDEAAWLRLQPKTRAIIEHACLEKKRWSRNGAWDAVARLRRKGDQVSAYRCPFKGDHWHVGHIPSMATVEDLALAVRDLHGNLPTRVDKIQEGP